MILHLSKRCGPPPALIETYTQCLPSYATERCICDSVKYSIAAVLYYQLMYFMFSLVDFQVFIFLLNVSLVFGLFRSTVIGYQRSFSEFYCVTVYNVMPPIAIHSKTEKMTSSKFQIIWKPLFPRRDQSVRTRK